MVTSEELRLLVWEISDYLLWCQFCRAPAHVSHTELLPGEYMSSLFLGIKFLGQGEEGSRALCSKPFSSSRSSFPWFFSWLILWLQQGSQLQGSPLLLQEQAIHLKLHPSARSYSITKQCRCLCQGDLVSISVSVRSRLSELWFHILVYPWIITTFHGLEGCPWQSAPHVTVHNLNIPFLVLLSCMAVELTD